MLLRLLALPISAPGSSMLFIARQIHEHAMREYTAPSKIKQELECLEDRLENNEISETEFEIAEDKLIVRLTLAARWHHSS